MVHKFFPLDKNYLLEEAQFALQEILLSELFDKVKTAYDQNTNPLGLQDEFSKKISKYKPTPRKLKTLNNFYKNMAAAYRFKYSDNQLEFLWDGRDQSEKYREEWATAFLKLMNEFCKEELFVQAVLDLTVFFPENQKADLVESRMNNFMLRHFEVKFHKTKGMVAMKVA